jgi:hypothetical protein
MVGGEAHPFNASPPYNMENKMDIKELNEIELEKELPRKILVGQKVVLVRQLTFDEYLTLMSKIARYYPKHLKSFIILLSNAKKSEQGTKQEFFTAIQNAVLINNFKKDMMEILNWMFPVIGKKFFGKSYLEKNITPFQILCLVEALWDLNFSLLKKKLQEVKMKVGLANTQSLPSQDTSNKTTDGVKENSSVPQYPKFSPTSTEKMTTVASL